MASLFGKNRLREIAQRIDTDDILDDIKIIEAWYEDYRKGSLKADKETSREQSYNRDFFIKILGYQEKPFSPFTLEPKTTSDQGQFPDAVLGYTDKTAGIENISAVVELKGASIDLDRPQRRDGNMSPVQQGFKYKPQFRNCPFVIVSNFWEFRLYHDNLLDYESWTLADLVNPAGDYQLFKTWYALLNQANLTSKKGPSKTENLLTDIRVEQQEIGKKFYKVYKEARLDLLRDIYRNNDSVKRNIDMGIEKAQKIVDRIVFACFAEDKGLLPDDTLSRVVRAADHSVYGGSLWNTFKDFFNAIDLGSEKLEIPDGYNGGLFKRDDGLNKLEIGDESLRAVAALGRYDFNEDLSVTILGHIFEQSITDLEEIKQKVNAANDLESLSYNRRKKDGIFYTPDYIVRYIVENTLGKYLHEHEEKFKNEFGLKGDISDKTYGKREKEAYAKYYDFLSNIKVVDPACGSGAFLVYVFDYLLADHVRVGKILGLDKGVASFDEVYRNILQRNIFGVDLNEESVEITKLSLWLKSAQKGKKLTSLDQNIKCGNSLVSNPARPKSFNWQEQFPEVMSKGGFDVVIGNPPYVKEYTAKAAFDGVRGDPVYQGKMDLWYLFGSLALDIVKLEAGYIGFIAPSNWVTNSGAEKFRNRVLSDGKLIEFADFGDFKVFDQAGIQTMIYVMKRSASNDNYQFSFSKVLNSKINHDGAKQFLAKIKDDKFAYFSANINKVANMGSTLNFNDASIHEVLIKIKSCNSTFLTKDEVAQGIVAPQDYVNKKSQQVLGGKFKVGDGIFNLSNEELKQLNLTDKEESLIKPLYTTEELHRYYGNSKNRSWIIYTDSKYKDRSLIENYPRIKEHLDRFTAVITSDNKPYGLHRARDESFFKGEKIMSVRKCSQPTFTYTDFDCYVSQTFMVIKTERINAKYLTALLNSRLIAFWLKYSGKMQGDLYQIDKEPLLKIPILVAENQTDFIENASQLIRLGADLESSSSRFNLLVSQQFDNPKAIARIGKWWQLSFEDFLLSLKIELTMQKTDELLSLFEKYAGECQDIDSQMVKNESIINTLIFDLYGLDDQEISYIESLV